MAHGAFYKLNLFKNQKTLQKEDQFFRIAFKKIKNLGALSCDDNFRFYIGEAYGQQFD